MMAQPKDENQKDQVADALARLAAGDAPSSEHAADEGERDAQVPIEEPPIHAASNRPAVPPSPAGASLFRKSVRPPEPGMRLPEVKASQAPAPVKRERPASPAAEVSQ